MEFGKQSGAEIAQKFVTLLSKANVSSGKAVQTAEDLYKRHQIAKALPKAWNQLANDTIARLLIERTKDLCGHEPSVHEVNQFLSQLRLPEVEFPMSPPETDSVSVPSPATEPKPSRTVTGTKPVAFTFNGTRYEVMSWKEMLVRLCERVYEDRRDRFEEVLSLKKRKRPYFSKNPSDLTTPSRSPISDTGIFVETNFSAIDTLKAARAIIKHFGNNEDDLTFETRTP